MGWRGHLCGVAVGLAPGCPLRNHPRPPCYIQALRLSASLACILDALAAQNSRGKCPMGERGCWRRKIRKREDEFLKRCSQGAALGTKSERDASSWPWIFLGWRKPYIPNAMLQETIWSGIE